MLLTKLTWRRGGTGAYCSAIFPIALVTADRVTSQGNSSYSDVINYVTLLITSYIILRLQTRKRSGLDDDVTDVTSSEVDATRNVTVTRDARDGLGGWAWLGFLVNLGVYLLYTSDFQSSSFSSDIDVYVVLSRVVTLSCIQISLPLVLPKSFTPGEAALMAHIIEHCIRACVKTFRTQDTGFCFRFRSLEGPLMTSDGDVTLFIQISGQCCLLVVVLACCVPPLRRPAMFYSLVLAVITGISYPVLNCYLGRDFITWLCCYITNTSAHVWLFCYWTMCFLVAGTYIVLADPSLRKNLQDVIAKYVHMTSLPAMMTSRGSDMTSRGSAMTDVELISLRKQFHVLIIAVFLPGVLYDVQITSLAIACAVQIFCMAETLRVFNIPPLGPALNANLALYADDKDEGAVLLTPIYLLIGCGLPLLLLPFSTDKPIGLLSGVISVGVGDAFASVVGSRYGRVHWPGTKKTLEGSLAGVISQIIFVLVVKLLSGDTDATFFNVTFASVVTSVLEAYTTQIDNLILPLIFFIFLYTPLPLG